MTPAAVEWYRIEAPYFCAAVRAERGVIVATPPMLDWILGRRDRSVLWLSSYARRHHWTLERLEGVGS